jgi:DNA mismatch repair protein MutL
MRSQPAVEPQIQVNPDYNPFKKTSGNNTGNSKTNFTKAIHQEGFGNAAAKPEDWEQFYQIKEEEEIVDQSPEIAVDTAFSSGNFLVKDNYIFTPGKSGFLVVHARRAVERTVYDNILSSFISSPINSQTLLFPLEKELSRQEAQHWEDSSSVLKQLGFDAVIEDNVLIVHSVPSVLEEETLSKSLDSILETLAYKDLEKGDLAHRIVGSIARSAAMKHMELTSKEQIQSLIDRLFQCENHTYSPSNKKIVDTLDLALIHKKFE